MKIEYFRKFTFRELKELRNLLMSDEHSDINDAVVNDYINTERKNTSRETRVRRCIVFIDQCILTYALTWHNVKNFI